MPPTGQAPDISAVQMTATALATILAPPISGTEATTDPNIGGGTPGDTGTEPTPTIEIVDNGSGGGNGLDGNLPNTGLFDDVFGGSPATILFAAFGLLGVIVLSRGIRASNRKRKRK
ncbi:MAG: hypothetical protein Q9P01_04145 [Anaerolineae bacterium]|nr:hypothetical protein [Anaerolineae bacterium]